jgi:hypothetical protein
MGSDRFLTSLLGRPSETAPAPAAGAVTTPTGALRVPGTASPVDLATNKAAPTAQQVVDAVRNGRVTITDELMVYAEAIDPKLPAFLDKLRKAQIDEEKNRIEQEKSNRTTRTETPRGTTTARAMDVGQYEAYQKALKQFLEVDGDEQKYLRFLDSQGWLDFSQARNRKIPKAGEQAEPIPLAKSQAESDAEKERMTKTAAIRAEEAEKAAGRLLSAGRNAFANSNTADDMIGYATNNPRVFEIMNKPGIFGSVTRAAKEGLTSGNFTVSIPTDKILDYKLTKEDLTALQMFAQKSAELQTRGRQLNRTPGEGSMSDFETKLLGGIYALPSDTQRAVILKSQALKAQGAFDRAAAEIWNRKSKQPGYDYNDFTFDKEFLALQQDYEATLKEMRQNNLDLLSPKRKEKAPATPAPAASAPSAPATSSKPSATPLPSSDPSVPSGYIRDPKTGVIRKKREGE